MSVVYRSDLSPLSPQSMWRRARVYLIALGTTTVGFFFVAGWLAAPDAATDLSLWREIMTTVSGLLVAALGLWHSPRRHHRTRNKRQ